MSIHAAALKALEWFRLDLDSLNGSSADEEEHGPASPKSNNSSKGRPASKKTVTDAEKVTPNKPLKFRLDKLDTEHPYLRERGLTPETIRIFDIGFCEKGMMSGRIAIPISNSEGAVVAYAGRLLEDPTDDIPKYKFPPGFLKTLELFNLHRAKNEPEEMPLVIVEGFFDCMKLYQNGCRRVIALMGSWLDENQRELIRKHFSAQTQIILALGEDKAGRAAREIMAHQLARICFVRVQEFKEPDTQPENLTLEEVQKLIGGVL